MCDITGKYGLRELSVNVNLQNVISNPHTLHFSASCAALPSKKTVSDGVLGFLEMLMISLRRGTPSVTFFADTPA